MPAKTKRPRPARPTSPPPAAPPSRVPVVLLWTVVPVTIAALMAWYASLARAEAGVLSFPLDDSWIHIRFAQNLAAGKGFSFNPGVPTSTTTSVLWTLLLAGAYRITHEYLFTAMAINWGLSVLLCVLVYQLALLLHPDRWFALVAAVTMSLTAPLPWWALSGMEPPLYATLALLAVWLHLRGRSVRGPRTMLPAAVMGLAALSRPELLLLFPLALADSLVMTVWIDKEPGGLRRWLARLAWQAPVFLLLVAPQFLYNYHVTGYWLPSSFYSKLQPDGFLAREAGDWGAIATAPFRELWSAVRMWAKTSPLLLPLFLFGMWLMVREFRSQEERPRSLLIPALLVLQLVFWALAGGYRAPQTQSQRYVAHLDALFVLVGVYGGWRAMTRLPALRPVEWRAACVLGVFALAFASQPSAAAGFARNVKNITEMQVVTARWLHDNTPKDSLVVANDIGAIGVFSDRRILDIQGLVSTEVLAPRAATYRQVYLERQPPSILADFILARHPDYIVIFPAWYPEIAARRDLLTPVFAVDLKDNITSGAPLMVVYRTVWAERPRR